MFLLLEQISFFIFVAWNKPENKRTSYKLKPHCRSKSHFHFKSRALHPSHKPTQKCILHFLTLPFSFKFTAELGLKRKEQRIPAIFF
jgi:hypothetical protein